MGAFQYKALKQNGAACKGVLEADSERHARQLLREKNLIPTEVFIVKKANNAKHRNKLSSQELTLFTRQLATLLAAGIPVEESLQAVSEQSEKAKTRQLIIAVRSKVMEGYSLAQALDEYPIAFPDLYRATVAAGEHSGKLDLVLERLADYTERQQGTKQKIQHALIYPIVMMLVSSAIISFLLVFVVPKIIEVFTDSGQELPFMTQVLINISYGFKSYGAYLLVLVVALLVGFKKSLNNITIRMRWHSLLLKLPLIAYFSRSINTARYIHSFSILFAAGVSVLETMRVSASLINNLKMRAAFDKAALWVREGSTIQQALKETGYIGPMTIHLIASGEKSGQISKMMEHAAGQLDNEIKGLIDTGLTLLEPLIILLMGGVVLFIVLATLLPIFTMEQLVS